MVAAVGLYAVSAVLLGVRFVFACMRAVGADQTQELSVVIASGLVAISAVILAAFYVARAGRWSVLVTALIAVWGLGELVFYADALSWLSAAVGLAMVALVVTPSSRRFVRARRSHEAATAPPR